MAENIHDGLIIMENNIVVFVNRRIAEITGYSFEELWKMNPLSIIDPEDKETVASQIKKMDKEDQGLTELRMWIREKTGNDVIHQPGYLLYCMQISITFLLS